VERHLTGEAANSFSVAGELSLHDLGPAFAGECMKDQSHRFFWTASGRTGNASHPEPKSRVAAFANPFGESHRYFTAYSSVLLYQLWWHTRELRLERVRVHHCAAQEVSRTSTQRGDAFRQQSSRAGFRYGQRGAAHLQVVTDDLLHRISVVGKYQ